MPTEEYSISADVNYVYGLVLREDKSDLSHQVANLIHEAWKTVGQQINNDVAVQQHPLGFLCAKWKLDAERTLRIHVWDSGLNYCQEPNWPIHDHTFSFKSIVLSGKVQNKLYVLSDKENGRKFELFEVEYADERSSLVHVNGSISITPSSTALYQNGDAYNVDAGALHRTALRSGFAVTVLATNRVQSASDCRPRVIGSASGASMIYDRRVMQTADVLAQLERARQQLMTDPLGDR